MKTYLTIDLFIQSFVLSAGLVFCLVQSFYSNAFIYVLYLMLILAVLNLFSAFIKYLLLPSKKLFIYMSLVVLYFTISYFIRLFIDSLDKEGILFYLAVIIPFLLSLYYCCIIYFDIIDYKKSNSNRVAFIFG